MFICKFKFIKKSLVADVENRLEVHVVKGHLTRISYETKSSTKLPIDSRESNTQLMIRNISDNIQRLINRERKKREREREKARERERERERLCVCVCVCVCVCLCVCVSGRERERERERERKKQREMTDMAYLLDIR